MIERTPNELIENSKKWSEDVKKIDPGFFFAQAEKQTPDFLWIGCSDSRVPAEQILDVAPGEIFVHRNIANLANPADPNCMAVIDYAAEKLQVKHIIVCGHTECGGIIASLGAKSLGFLEHWLSPVRALYRRYLQQIEALECEKAKADLLCTLNIREQVKNIVSRETVQTAWKSGRELAVHGWMYRIEEGRIEDLNISIRAMSEIPELP